MRLAAIFAVLAALLAGCGGGQPAARPVAAAAPSNVSRSAVSLPLVGHWERLTTCAQRVSALKAAGLGRFAAEHAAGEGWLRGVSSPEEIDDPRHPCRGAVPLVHGHFFTDDGLFGSTDQHGDQVDDGTYRVLDDDTIVIEKEFGDVTFHYRVEGDSLFLDPVMPSCARSGCFAAQWAVAVAYPGLPWASAD